MSWDEQREALQIQRDALYEKLPERLATLLDDASNASFGCGQYGEGADDEPPGYDEVYLTALRTEVALFTALLQLLSNGEPLK